MWLKIRNLLWDNPFQPWFISTMIIIDILGSFYGYYWYRYQLAENAVYWWLFIPDSPLATTLTAVALLLVLQHRNKAVLFQLLAYTAIIKYGIWAVVLISHFALSGAYIAPEIWMLWFSHLGMAAEGFIYLRHLEVNLRQVALVCGWMLFNDYLDYGLGLHPYLYAASQWKIALFSALLLSIGLSILKIYSMYICKSGRKFV